MDLVQTIRKEGSRGGRTDFKWEDVKADSQRENYLGHSLMAPVGRWQKGRDLNWYAKGDADDKQSAEEKIKEEKKKLKEAEEDAMLAAMGLPVPVREAPNANLTPLGEKAKEVDIKEAIEEKAAKGEREGREKSHRRDRSMDRRDKDRSRRDRDDDHRRRRHRSRSRSRGHRDRRRDRSRSRERRRDKDDGRRRHRSRSREDRRDERRHHHRERDADDERPISREHHRRRRTRSPYDRPERRRD